MQKSAINTIGALLLMTACNTAVLEPQQMGSITLSLSSDIEVEAQTKADNSIDCSGFSVFINGTTLVGTPYSQTYLYSQMTDKNNVPFGTYVLSAENCDENEAIDGFGCARYTGESEQIQVRSEETVPVSITCHMINAKASITLHESFTQDFTSITASLTIGDRSVTVIDQSNTSGGQEVYFNVPVNGGQLVYRITGTIAGKELTYTNASSPMLLEPAKWAKILIKSNHNGIIGKPDIDVNDDMEDNYVTEIIDPEQGTELTGGTMNLPSIIVNSAINDVEVIPCEIEVY